MQEWYLMTPTTRPNMTSGFENDSFNDWKDDAFYETLQTDIADTVIIYNYDLSESREIRGIVEGNTADTKLKSMERSILVPIGTLHSGDYIFFEDEYWIVDGRPGNNKIYEKATLKECQYKLRWQKDDGTIVERWSNLTSASKYDVGTEKNSTIILTSNNYTIIIPNDEDSMTINGKRVFIDLSKVPEKVFEITRNDDVLFNHDRNGGTLSLIADKTEFNPNTDNQELWICDYKDTTTLPPHTTSLNATISGSTNIKIGFQRAYIATLSDEDGNVVNWNNSLYRWNVVCGFNTHKIHQDINKNKISLTVDDDSLIGESFLLQIIKLDDNFIISEVEITIIEAF